MNLNIEKNKTLEELIKQLSEIKGDEEVVINFEKESKILENPLSIKILKKFAKKDGLSMQINVDNEPFLEEEELENSQNTQEVPETTVKNEKKAPKLKKSNIGKIIPGGIIPARLLIVFFGIFLLFGGSAFALLYLMPKATISVFVENEILSKGIDVVASPSAQRIISEDRVIPAQALSFTQTAEKEIETTGEKEVGDKATGTVTVYNKTDTEKTLPAGTKLFTISESENLEFVTLEEIKVPARTTSSSAEIVTYTSGKKDVQIEAAEIGEKYNLGEGEELSIEQFSTNLYIARTNEGVDGGSSRTVKVVTQQDQDNIADSLEKDLLFKALESFSERASKDQVFDQKAVTANVESLKYSAAVGEEADTVKGTQTSNYEALVFYRSDLQGLMDTLVEEFVPENFSLAADSRDIEVENIELDDEEGILRFTAKFRGLVVPELNKDQLIESITGKSIEAAENFLNEIPKKKGFEIKITPNLTKFWNRLPFKKENIKIEIVSE